MAREKRAKTKIKRRSAGLVITPPMPRPVASDHPARLLFKDAIASAKAASDLNLAENKLAAELRDNSESEAVMVAEVKRAPVAPPAEPLQIFKELKGHVEAPREEILPQPSIKLDHPRERSSAFEEHFSVWRPFLTEGQMCILEALYDMTHAKGTDTCMSSMPKLAAASGVSERQTYNVVKELEKHGFIERPETFNTPTKKGTIFRLHLTRRSLLMVPDRQYHYED
jgi:DNA-binding MarR family transcriptional regulator